MKFAVGYINSFDNDLVIEIIKSNNFRHAIRKHSAFQSLVMQDWTDNMPYSLEEIKMYFFDCDSAIDVVEI